MFGLKTLPAIDPFLLGLVTSAALGSLIPCQGGWATLAQTATTLAIGVMFFMQGVRLSRQAIIAGLAHWRLHLAILACTFVLYPALGLSLRAVASPLLPASLWTGVIFLCLLPSTVQSSIAYVSIARGDVAAAVCAATASNLLGVLLTPVLAALVLGTHAGAAPLNEVGKIATHILAPFIVGHLLRPWLGDWAARHKPILTLSDRGSILLAVYTAFSAAALEGIWRQVTPLMLLTLLAVEALLLTFVLTATTLISRRIGFPTEDEIALVFCGSKKSLASGAPIASVIFPAATLGGVIIPLVLFHQMQLMVAAALARRYAQRASAEPQSVAEAAA